MNLEPGNHAGNQGGGGGDQGSLFIDLVELSGTRNQATESQEISGTNSNQPGIVGMPTDGIGYAAPTCIRVGHYAFC